MADLIARPTPPSHHTRFDTYTLNVPDGPPTPWPRPFEAWGVARALTLCNSTLWFYVLHTHKLYTRHAIPKKSGKLRILHVPDQRLAWAQRRILRTFLDPYPWPAHVSAYVLGRSPVETARLHANRPFLAIVDLKDFFPSVPRGWVKDALVELLGLYGESAEILATLVTAPWEPGVKAKYRVPQGAPTSGAIANLVAVHRLDPGILDVCARFGMTYTRYADDLAFSRETPVCAEEASAFIRAILRAVRHAGFFINYDKIRVQRRNRQQRLLGMTINEFPNIPKRDYRRVRAMAHHIRHKGYAVVAKEQGYESAEALSSYMDGIISYYRSVSPQRADNILKQLRGDRQ